MAGKRRNQLFLSFMAPLPPPRAIYIVRPKCQSPSRIHQPGRADDGRVKSEERRRLTDRVPLTAHPSSSLRSIGSYTYDVRFFGPTPHRPHLATDLYYKTHAILVILSAFWGSPRGRHICVFLSPFLCRSLEKQVPLILSSPHLSERATIGCCKLRESRSCC